MIKQRIGKYIVGILLTILALWAVTCFIWAQGIEILNLL